MSRQRARSLCIWLMAAWVTAVAGARLELIRQPVGNGRKGFPLETQPRIEVVLDAVDELTPAGHGTTNSLGGVVLAPMHRITSTAPSTRDVTNFNEVVVQFGRNPTGATFAGGASHLRVKLEQGVFDFSDHPIDILQGGADFTLSFSVHTSLGEVVTTESKPFNCGGQEARLVIVQQPILTVEGANSTMTPPILHVVDSYERLLEQANPVVTVSLFYNPGDTEFSRSSETSVQASNGTVLMDNVFLTRACTEIEEEVPAHLRVTRSTKYKLRFQSPGFPDVISEEFETLPILKIQTQPLSNHQRTVQSMCVGNFSGCSVFLSDYLRDQMQIFKSQPSIALEKLQTALLHVDVSCTDLDGPGEYVTAVKVGNRQLKPGVEFTTGPWEECGFAGCRGQCDTNLRSVVSHLDVKNDLGTYDSVTNIYTSQGSPLLVHVALTDKVNICPCDGQPLKMFVKLDITYSQAPEEQGHEMPQQPRLLLLNADGTPYTLRRKIVRVHFAPGGNPAGAELAGNTALMSEGGVVEFTDLAVTEGAKGYMLRFSVQGVFNANSTSIVDSEPLDVGCGTFPQLTLDCVDCSAPAPSRQEARSLSQPAQLELQRWHSSSSSERSPSNVEVRMLLVTSKDVEWGMFSRDTKTVRNADRGSVKFSDTTIYNGNCAFCPKKECGEGYILYFVANDNWIQSTTLNIAGGNRSPRFISPTPNASSTFAVIMAVESVQPLFTLNVTDDNHDDVELSLTSGQGLDTVKCVGGTDACLLSYNGAQEWGQQIEFKAQPDDDQCTRPLFAGNGPSHPVDGLYWGVHAAIRFTPKCSQAAPTYPPIDGGPLKVEKVCFAPKDKVTRVDIETVGQERCFNVKVMTPAAPFFIRPFRWNHVQAGIEHIAKPTAEQESKIGEQLKNLTAQRLAPPAETFLPPHTGGRGTKAVKGDEDFQTLYVGVGCKMVLPLVAAEVQSQVISGDLLKTRLRVRALRTTRSSLYGQTVLDDPRRLPAGAFIHEGELANPHVSSFEWEPARGQEGYIYSVCLEIVAEFQFAKPRQGVDTVCEQRFFTAPYHGHKSQYCIDIRVQRCKYCMRLGDSLEGVARAWNTTVLQLWGGNPDIMQPNLMMVGTLLNLGIVYTADVDDRLPILAAQAGRTVQDLLDWNPDLPHDAELLRGDDVLISSATLYGPREAPWAIQNGTFVADSQAVCVLPAICTFSPLPEVQGEVEAESFSCGMCEDGTEFCTGAICVKGEGPGPWPLSKCWEYRGSRCDRCAVCREEEFDIHGHIVVPGTWRRSGCDGSSVGHGVLAEDTAEVSCIDCTPDATCAPCDRCSDGEIETAPCTPLSNRVCVKVGATVGGDGRIIPPPTYKGVFLPAHK